MQDKIVPVHLNIKKSLTVMAGSIGLFEGFWIGGKKSFWILVVKDFGSPVVNVKEKQN
jgi:hypothetical protein